MSSFDDPWSQAAGGASGSDERGTYPAYESGDSLCFYADSPVPMVCLKCGQTDSVERAPSAVTATRGRVTRRLTTALPFCEKHRRALLGKGWRWYEIALGLWGLSTLPWSVVALLDGALTGAFAGCLFAAALVGVAFFLRSQRKYIAMNAEWIDDDHMMRLRGVHPEARRVILAGTRVASE